MAAAAAAATAAAATAAAAAAAPHIQLVAVCPVSSAEVVQRRAARTDSAHRASGDAALPAVGQTVPAAHDGLACQRVRLFTHACLQHLH